MEKTTSAEKQHRFTLPLTHNRPKSGYHHVQRGEPVSFIEVTYRSRNDSRAAESPRPATAHKSWEPGASRQLNRFECPFQVILVQAAGLVSESLQLFSLRVCITAQLLWVFLVAWFPSESLLCTIASFSQRRLSAFTTYTGKEGPSNLISFRDSLKLV